MSRFVLPSALKIVPLVAAAGLALAACGTDGASVADRTPPPAEATAPPVAKGAGAVGNANPGAAANGGADDTGTRPNGAGPLPGSSVAGGPTGN